jgi:type VI protein secretion system component VasK
MNDNQESWHLSKSVPIGLIFGLITQGAAIVWIFSMMVSDIERNRMDIVKAETRINRLEDVVQQQAVSMARIDENIKAIRQAVEQMASRGAP